MLKFKEGDRVRNLCDDFNQKIFKGKLKVGDIYTVSKVWDDTWNDGRTQYIKLKELEVSSTSHSRSAKDYELANLDWDE